MVADYLSRCLFSMFAEDVELLPKDSFVGLLTRHREAPATLLERIVSVPDGLPAGLDFCATQESTGPAVSDQVLGLDRLGASTHRPCTAQHL